MQYIKVQWNDNEKSNDAMMQASNDIDSG